MILFLFLVLTTTFSPAAMAQARGKQTDPAAPTAAAETPRRFAIRFLTDSEYPPFHYLDDGGVLTGFDVDLARAICTELSVQCEITSRPWEGLLPALRKGEGDAVIAALRMTPELAAEFELTRRYFYLAARFAGRRSDRRPEVSPETLERLRIGVLRGSPHEAYLRTFFRDSIIETFAQINAVQEALMAGRVDLVFADAIGLVFWVNGSASQECCELKGGAYYEPRFFGDGLTIAVPRQDRELKRLIDEALTRLMRSGRHEELLLRYFPNRVF